MSKYCAPLTCASAASRATIPHVVATLKIPNMEVSSKSPGRLSNLCIQNYQKCLKDEKLEDATSAALLWHLLILLCRQNGRIMGSDVAELLTRDCRSLGACGVSGEPTDGEILIYLSETPTPGKETFNITDLTGYPPTDKEAAE
ncbi:protein transport protein Sec16A-like [Carassius auratus]|uniref:Protein transport protein Sec16A-like n=1 Tax=Carassius auratus TaxID=7957 RepID=A0A6P6KEY1_CARAU|nr:protein transport protein Sec16A-like [Carassius auratus]